MVKVITYGTYDLLHYGHIRLLERAKALGDYLIVGVTADDFDKTRGKFNVQQSLMERVEAVRATGIADEIIIEEYEGQKIDDIRRYNVDIFTVGSDWKGKFDYLNEYCKVVYLDRTQGVSSSEIRAEKRKVKFGLVGETSVISKFANECEAVNGIELAGVCTRNQTLFDDIKNFSGVITENYDPLLEKVDAVYLFSEPSVHYEQIKKAIEQGKHVLCETPVALTLHLIPNYLYERTSRSAAVFSAFHKVNTVWATLHYSNNDVRISVAMQVLQRWLVLRCCFLASYVPLPSAGNANVPAVQHLS